MKETYPESLLEFLEIYQKIIGKAFLSEQISPELVDIFKYSKFLPRWMNQNPHLIDQILSSPYLEKEKNLHQFEIDLEEYLHKKSDDDWKKSLRIFKYQELLRITLKDFKNGVNQEILRELSYLALCIIKQVIRKVYLELEEKFGTPQTLTGEKIDFEILAMGKLGGLELNYSSDIDLIPFISTSKGGCKDKSAIEFYSLLVKNFTQIMKENTEYGFLYRVDWDLRPESKAGPLVNSLSGLESYYESFGADWERQAMIKATPVLNENGLGDQFLKKIEPFIYRKYFDLNSIEKILSMKKKIHQGILKQTNEGINVKLGIGGIREIEFFVQAFLLIYGGKNPELRSKNTLITIQNLTDKKMLNLSEADQLTKDYLFLRSLEHRLQLIEERQTHLLPNKDDFKLFIAHSLGFSQKTPLENLEEFTHHLLGVNQRVHEKFENLFAPESHQESIPFKLPKENVPQLRIIHDALENYLKPSANFEEKLNDLRVFKKKEFEKIIVDEQIPHLDRKEQCLKLSLLAETIIQKALQIATAELAVRFGNPYLIDDDHKLPASLLILGMGKFGGYELGYQSDLDVIFIFSEHGQTDDGEKNLTNTEYFAKLVQKIISIISTPTGFGRCYEIDTELRPSGHFGPLVISFESFLDYQRKNAQQWEKQALLRARPVAGAYEFANMVSHQLEAFLYGENFSKNITKEMHRLRLRVENEIAKETSEIFNFKTGLGGIMDIEFILQFFQLTKGYQLQKIRTGNTFIGLDELAKTDYFQTYQDGIFLKEAYYFYRDLEAKLSIYHPKTSNRISKLNPILDQVAPLMNFEDGKNLMKQLEEIKLKVRKIYLQIFKD